MCAGVVRRCEDLRATYSGDAAFASSVDQDAHQVNAAVTPQTITFGALADKTYGDAPFTVSATGGASGNPVTFTAAPAAVCTAGGTNGSTITIQGSGTCSVSADQAGNASYGAAPTVTRSFIVAKAPLTVTADPKTKVQGSANPPLTATITGYVLGQNPATSGVTGAPDCTTTATTGSPAATLPDHVHHRHAGLGQLLVRLRGRHADGDPVEHAADDLEHRRPDHQRGCEHRCGGVHGR